MLNLVLETGDLLDDFLALVALVLLVGPALGYGAVDVVDGLGDDDGPALAAGGPAKGRAVGSGVALVFRIMLHSVREDFVTVRGIKSLFWGVEGR